MDAEILAISVDHIHAHRVFSASLGRLPYPLLSDWHKQTAKTYQVFDAENEIAKWSVFLVNKEGMITFVNTSFKAGNQDQYEEVLVELQKLN